MTSNYDIDASGKFCGIVHLFLSSAQIFSKKMKHYIITIRLLPIAALRFLNSFSLHFSSHGQPLDPCQI